MLKHTITATEMSRELSAILNKVHYQGQSFEIQRGREIIAKIIPVTTSKNKMKVSELKDFLVHLPPLDKKDRQDFSEIIQEIRSNLAHEQNPWD